MDCAPVPKLIDGPEWVYEIKLDGYRAIAIKYGDSIDLFSRRRKSFVAQYPYIVEALRALSYLCASQFSARCLSVGSRPSRNSGRVHG
jgi:bifunctional non-homologous end joining protein LigD